jgi:hypothetical protein
MSGDEAAGDAPGQQGVTHIILRAEGWFVGPDRVLPVAATSWTAVRRPIR